MTSASPIRYPARLSTEPGAKALLTRLALAVLLLAPAAAVAAEKVVVFPLAPKLGVKPEVAEVVNDTFVSALQSRGVQVITQKDVENMMRLEQKKAALSVSVAQKLGSDTCTADTECLAQIGGALGARYLVTGSLSKLGGSLQFTAELMDQLKGKVVQRFNQISKRTGDDAYVHACYGGVGHSYESRKSRHPDERRHRSAARSRRQAGGRAEIVAWRPLVRSH
ncbi:MAG: hypothetical protein ACK4N5_20750 [Myxococcales bacterium]